MKKMKIGFHPYTFVRTNVMRSLLLKKEDYHKLVKMKVAEITRYLQERTYQQEINELGGSHTSSELIEKALMNNLDKSFAKLRRICQGNVSVLVDQYLQRYDVENMKIVLRATKTGQDSEEAKFLISDVGTYPAEMYNSALDLTYEEALEKFMNTEIIDFSVEGRSLLEIETEMDKSYYRSLLKMSERLTQNGELFREFIEQEIKMVNVLTILRMKKNNMPSDQIKSLLILSDGVSKNLQKVIDAKDVSEVLKKLSRLGYKEIVEEGRKEYEENNSLVGIERILKKRLLRKSVLFLHQNLLSVNVILGYMFAKETEVRNLRLLIKGKKLGLEEDYVEKEMII